MPRPYYRQKGFPRKPDELAAAGVRHPPVPARRCRSDLNIQQIITQVGYENTSYFYRLFHERYGQSPREYRRARSQRT